MNRIATFDIMKGIGILLVIVGHSDLLVQDSVKLDCYSLIYSCHMPLFFIICGFFTILKRLLWQ